MATLVCLHAHPDDEAISTGGSMARAADEGHRVVLVVATNGDHGEVPSDLVDGETLVDRRRAETARSAEVLGVARVVWLDYRDSGMTGWAQNADPRSFHQADLDEAAGRVAAVLREEDADVLTSYDWHGTYGHPDHVKVHHVGRRAAELVSGVRHLQATTNRDALAEMVQAAAAAGSEAVDFDLDEPADDGNLFGEPASAITLCVDVAPFVDRKRRAIAAHRSQVTDSSFFMELDDEAFAMAFGREWFIEDDVDVDAPLRTGWIFEAPASARSGGA